MSLFKCKMCGATLNIEKDKNIIECEYCGTKQTVPVIKTKEIEDLYESANYFFHNNEYDKAASIYEDISTENPYDPESYFMLSLCKYGIEYVEDPKSKKRIPTLHRLHYESVVSDINFKKAIKHADSTQKIIYEQEAKYIDDVRNRILDISKKEKPYDVFICYKETDEKGQRTEDSILAMDIYNELTKEGLKVFFSKVTLEDKLGIDYEPYIFAALNSAKVMVVVGTKPKHINSPWVRNEWTRFLDRINKNKSNNKNIDNCYIVPAYKGMSPYALPNEFSLIQAQDMSKVGAIQDLVHGIKKLLNKADEINKDKAKLNVKFGMKIMIGIFILIIFGIVLMININKKISVRGIEYGVNETYESLSIQGISDLNKEDISQLKKIISIQNLYFKDCILENLDFLNELINVKGVQFDSSTKVNECKLSKKCENIEVFKIDTHEGKIWENIEFLKNMPNLKKIYIPICEDLTPISNHKKLEEVELYSYNQGIIMNDFLWCEGLDEVKKFVLMNYGGLDYTRNDNIFKGIEYLRNVEELKIVGPKISGKMYLNEKDLYYIGKLEKVKSLEIDLRGTYTKYKTEDINNLNLMTLQTMKNLEYLRIATGNNFELSGLGNLKKLRSIELHGDVINDNLLCINNLINLETLSLNIKEKYLDNLSQVRYFSLKGIEELKALKMIVLNLETYNDSIVIIDEELAKKVEGLNYQVIK